MSSYICHPLDPTAPVDLRGDGTRRAASVASESVASYSASDPSNQAYRLGLKAVGEDVIIWPLAKVLNPELISIGNSVIIDDFVLLGGSEGTEIGSFVHIGAHTSIGGGGRFSMGDFSGLSGGVRVYTGNEDYLGGSLTNPAVPPPWRMPTRADTHIGRHAIVGANAVLLPGVTLGEGAVVGAGSLVTGDCEPWTINVGSPARPIKDRPSERIIALEADLRSALFDPAGSYICSDKRLGSN